ncbi:MAG: tetratricopeptide repeat protein [Leptospiraceae bacterium]
MKSKSIVLIALVLILGMVHCQSAQRSDAVDRDVPANVDPAKLSKSRELIRQGNLAVVRKQYAQALDLANQSLAVLPLFEGYYLKGLALSRSGNEQEALQAFEQAEKLDPTDQQLLLTSGLLYDSLNQPEKAQEKYLKLTEAYPNDPVYWYRAGVGFKNLGKLDKAYEYLKKSLKDDFEHIDQAYLQLGDVCLEQKKYEESEEYFALAGKKNPKMEEAADGRNASQSARLMDQGNALLKEGKTKEAIQIFLKAVQTSPGSAAPRFLLGNAYLQNNEPEKALPYTEEGIKISPDSVSGRVIHATALRKNGKTLQARKVLEEGLARDPEQIELLNQLGLACRDAGDTKCALVQFEKALKIKPEHYPSRLNAFYTYIDARRYDEAERHLNALQKLSMPDKEKEQAITYFKLARYLGTGDRYFEKNAFYQAVVEYQKALKVDPESTAALNSLGRTELLRRRFGVAEKYYKKALQVDGENVQALEGLLRLYSQAGNAVARRNIQIRLEKLSETNPEAAVAFGRIYEDDENWKQAEAHYQRLLKRYPEHELIRRRLSYVVYRQALDENRKNNPDAALRLIARSEKLDPDLPGLASAKEVILDNKKHARYLPELERAEDTYQSGRFARAEKLFRTLHAKWPRPAFLVRIADSLIQQGKEQEGFRLLEKAASENPSSMEVREAMFANFIRAGRSNEAREGFQSIVNSQEDAYYSHYKLGIIHLMNDDPEDAFDSFQTALIYRPDFIPARLARGVALYEQGKQSESEKDFREALKYDTFGKELARLNLALIDLNSNEVSRARKALEDMVRMYPNFSDPHYHLSFLDFESGNYRAALKHIDKAIELETTADYHKARARILEKMPGQRAALEKTYRSLLQDFPGLPEEDRKEVRLKLSRLSSGEARTLSPMEMPAVDPVKVVRHRDLVIYIERNRVVAAPLGSETPVYIRKFAAPILDGAQDYWIYVAFRNQIISLDPLTGETVDQWEMPNTCRLLGADGKMAAITGTSCGAGKEKELRALGDTAEQRILSPQNFVSSSNGTFYYSGGFYHSAPSGGKVTLTKVSFEGESLTSTHSVQDVLSIHARNGDLLVAHKKGVLFLDEDDLEESSRLTLKLDWLDMAGETIYAMSGKQLHSLESGEIVKSINLPVAARPGQSLHALPEGRLLYIGQDGSLRLIDSEGKVLWKEVPGKFDSKLLSVYY